MTRFDERTAVVTGAGSGIGRETALALAEGGANVVVTDVDREGGEGTVDRIADETDADATFAPVDVTDPDEVEAMVETARETYGGLDVAVNNAGLGSPLQPTAALDPSDWSRILDVNLTGVWRCMASEIDAMREGDGGAIVNVASILGKVGTRVHGLETRRRRPHEGRRARLRDRRDPGERGLSGVHRDADARGRGAVRRRGYRRRTRRAPPPGRLGDPREVADAIAWLCSPEASFATGEALAVDGGYLSR